MYRLRDVSSLNLRTIRRSEKRVIDDPISFECSVCGKKRWLGKTTFALVRLKCEVETGLKEMKVCGCCMDLLTDAARHGPRVITEAHKWLRSSRVARVSLVDEDLFCLNCLGTADSHLFIKYDDLLEGGKSSAYATKRICARCVISYLGMLIESEEVGRRRFPEMKVELYGTKVV
jgi:hypothetical protein